MAVDLIHGAVDIVLIEGFAGLQAAGLSQPSARGLLDVGELGAGKEQAAIDDSLEEAALTAKACATKELANAAWTTGAGNS